MLSLAPVIPRLFAHNQPEQKVSHFVSGRENFKKPLLAIALQDILNGQNIKYAGVAEQKLHVSMDAPRRCSDSAKRGITLNGSKNKWRRRLKPEFLQSIAITVARDSDLMITLGR